MISLIPLLIVIHKLSLRSAFEECITLWAKEWKNLLVFIAIGAFVLLIPVMLEGRVETVGNVGWVGIGGIAGWVVQIMKIALGAFLLSSFVVFLKELQE
jgi:cell division protein FtsW (lipid II flippase)